MTQRVFVGTHTNEDTAEVKAFFGRPEAALAFKSVAGKHVVDRSGSLMSEKQIETRLQQLEKIEAPNEAVVEEINQLHKGQTAIRHKKDDLRHKH
jgi:hypothetical protein